MILTPEDVEDIVRILDGSFVGELRLKTEKFEIVLRAEDDGTWTRETRTLATPALLDVATPTADAAPVAARPEPEPEGSGTAILSPLVGTFYRAPKPGAPPFVEVGDTVAPDTVIGIVEAMKLMNSVHAEASGQISEIRVANGEFVQRGRVLMRIAEDSA